MIFELCNGDFEKRGQARKLTMAFALSWLYMKRERMQRSSGIDEKRIPRGNARDLMGRGFGMKQKFVTKEELEQRERAKGNLN